MTALEIIHLVLKTTEDTSTILYRCLKEASKTTKEIVLKELNRPFSELSQEYIYPILFHIENKNDRYLNFHYKEGVDDLYIDDKRLLREEATMEWLSRKESELKKTLTLIDANSYETIKIEKFDIIADELFDYLIKHKFINGQEDRKLFTSIFTGNIIYEQPKIKWLKGIQYYNMFFLLLNLHGLIDLNSKQEATNNKVDKGLFFVNALKNNNKFERLSKRREYFEKKLKEYLYNESKDFKELKELEDIIKKIHKK